MKIVMDKVALAQVFSENFGFPCQSTFHLINTGFLDFVHRPEFYN
jgi:hypothetical protein